MMTQKTKMIRGLIVMRQCHKQGNTYTNDYTNEYSV